jgi:hypothetical protein
MLVPTARLILPTASVRPGNFSARPPRRDELLAKLKKERGL